MPTNVSSLERLRQLQTEIAKLQKSAVGELIDRRNTLIREIAAVDADIAKLSGKPIEGVKPRPPAPPSRGISLKQLREELAAAPNRTLNLRKANLELRNIKDLVQANPGLLQLGGNGAWPTVTLLTPGKSKLHPLEPELG